MKLTAKFLLASVFILLSRNLFAQEISTDRPDRTESAETVGKHKFQIETGIEYSSKKSKNESVSLPEGGELIGDVKTNTITVPTTLLRYGLTDKIELRLGIDFDGASSKMGDIDLSEDSKLSLNAPSLSAKFSLFKGEGWKPDFAIITKATLPNIGAEGKQEEHVVPELNFAFSNDISKDLSIGYNVGLESDYKFNVTDLFYSASLGINISDKTGSFIEIFGNTPDAKFKEFSNSIDGGFTYLIKNNFQVDIYGGLGLSSDANDFFLGTGFGYKF
jgi:hypothetical protein